MRLYLYILLAAIGFIFNNEAKAQCPAATPSVYDITPDSVSMSWTAASTNGYEYAILAATAPQPTTGTATTSTGIRVGMLSPGTPYKAWLRTHCGGGIYTPWIFISFSTPCGTPSTIGISNVKGDSADITWTSVNTGANYQYKVDTLSTNPVSGTAINTNTVRAKGLLPSKTYYVFVRTDCGTGIYSPWASNSFFTPWSLGINAVQTEMVLNAYPNPAHNIVTLQIPYFDNSTRLYIYNQVGATIKTMPIGNQQTIIDISSLPNGHYFFRINDKNTSKTIDVVKH